MRSSALVVLVLLSTVVPDGAAQQVPTHANFESPQIHPLDVAPDGTRLIATNTPAASLAVFSLQDPRRPVLLREIPTAPEPVTARFHTAREAWVVCHLADAVQVVDLDHGRIVDSIDVGDEPSDVVFAGGHAFVTVATRRQVVVLDATSRARVTTIELMCDEPRWATASADGRTVWVASHKSGNETTILPSDQAPPQSNGQNPALPTPPRVGRIVDSEDPAFAALHGVDLPDWDVFEIDTSTLAVRRRFSGVGTNLFGFAERTADRTLWVANTEARNLVRFEPNLRGHAVDNRVTRIALDGRRNPVTPIDLNPGVDRSLLPNPQARATALAQPTDVAWSPDESRLFVASFGTDRIGVLDARGDVVARIDIGPLTGSAVDSRSVRGPRGLAHSPTADVLYVLNRLSNSLSIVDTAANREIDELPMFDPTPRLLKEGRGFLYDAKLSGNGSMSCATCHVDAGFDGVAWDLGDPNGRMGTAPAAGGGMLSVHPMKGPMTTQTLRGLRPGGNLHWRGENAGLSSFNGAFESLLGGARLSYRDMTSFEAFVHSMPLPPNPNQNRDRSYAAGPPGSSAWHGAITFQQSFGGMYRQTFSCVSCHQTPNGTSTGSLAPGVTSLPQPFRAASLQTIYKRTGLRPDAYGRSTAGFGLQHDGAHADVRRHLQDPAFAVLSSTQRGNLQAFLESFDTGTAPAVGFTQRIDASNHTDPAVVAARDLLIAQASAQACDVIAHGELDGRRIGLHWDAALSRFVVDRSSLPSPTLAELDQWIGSGRARVVLIGVMPGEGNRLAIDRDRNGVPDGDERDLETFGHASGVDAPVLRGNSLPSLDRREFAMVVENAPPHASGMFLLSLGRVDNFRPYGVDVFVDLRGALAFQVPTDAHGVGVLPMPIPDQPALIGLRLHTQVIVPRPGQTAIASTGVTIEIRR